jgi:hypothetical protein
VHAGAGTGCLEQHVDQHLREDWQKNKPAVARAEPPGAGVAEPAAAAAGAQENEFTRLAVQTAGKDQAGTCLSGHVLMA